MADLELPADAKNPIAALLNRPVREHVVRIAYQPEDADELYRLRGVAEKARHDAERDRALAKFAEENDTVQKVADRSETLAAAAVAAADEYLDGIDKMEFTFRPIGNDAREKLEQMHRNDDGELDAEALAPDLVAATCRAVTAPGGTALGGLTPEQFVEIRDDERWPLADVRLLIDAAHGVDVTLNVLPLEQMGKGSAATSG